MLWTELTARTTPSLCTLSCVFLLACAASSSATDASTDGTSGSSGSTANPGSSTGHETGTSLDTSGDGASTTWSSTSATTADPETDSSSSSGTSEETGPIDVCGDGILGPTESCDDGNEVFGDGCSQCEVSGTAAWTTQYDIDTMDVRVTAIDVDPGNDDIALLSIHSELSGYISIVQRYGPGGDLLGSTTIEAPPGYSSTAAFGLCAGPSGRVYSAGSIEGSSDNIPRYRHLRAFDDLDVAWADNGPAMHFSRWVSCVVGELGPIVVGFDRAEPAGMTVPFVTSFDVDGEELWTTPWDEPVINVALGPDGRLVALGETLAGSMRIYDIADDGTATPSSSVHAGYRGYGELTVVEDAVYVGTHRFSDTTQPVLVKLDQAGAFLWERDPLAAFDDPQSPSLPSLAVSPHGEPVVVGNVWVSGVPHTYVNVYTSDGELLSSNYVDVDVDGVAGQSVPKTVVAGDGTLVVATLGSKATCDEPPCVLLQKQVI